MQLHNDDTIYAPATIPGTGAITVIRVSGPEALTIADKVVRCGKTDNGQGAVGNCCQPVTKSTATERSFSPITHDTIAQCCGSITHNDTIAEHDTIIGNNSGTIAEAKGYTIKFGTVIKNDGTQLDEVLVSVFRAPHSYTGENSVEISCHASSYIAAEIMSLLSDAGARPAAPGEFTQRAFLNGKMDLTQAEAVADVISAQNATAHRVAFNQMKGGFSIELKSMRAELLEMVSLMELELDFSEEDVEFADRRHLLDLIDKTISHIDRLSGSFRLGNAIKNGVPVAIVGATNAGKSTLLNALLGEERAIVSDIHGTTRDTIEETMNIDGVLFRFIDTAGLRETSDVIEKIGIERSYNTLHSAQIILGVLDGTCSEDVLRRCAEDIVSQVNLAEQKLWLIVNKCDVARCISDDVSDNGSDTRCADDNPSTKESPEKSKIPSDTEHYSASVTHNRTIGEVDWFNGDCHQTNGGLSARNLPDNFDNFFVNIPNIDVSLVKNKDIKVIGVSAKTGSGLEHLRKELSSSQKDLMAGQSTTLVTNQRHYDALVSASSSLSRARSGLASGIPSDLVAQDIREALYTLGTIVGEISTDEVLGNIFRNFCIGK